jgi:subtilisin family serine protease
VHDLVELIAPDICSWYVLVGYVYFKHQTSQDILEKWTNLRATNFMIAIVVRSICIAFLQFSFRIIYFQQSLLIPEYGQLPNKPYSSTYQWYTYAKIVSQSMSLYWVNPTIDKLLSLSSYWNSMPNCWYSKCLD